MTCFGRPLWSQRCQAGRFVTMVGAMLMVVGLATTAEARTRRFEAVGSVALVSLPTEAQTTYRLILAGGPFPYSKDGVIFANRERSLPRNPRGFYHEYTVRTPGASDRGARRIVCGGSRPAGDPGPAPAGPEVCYYTGDHYATFARIAN